MEHQGKSPPESLSKQCSQKDNSKLTKNVPWNPPGLQNASPDRCQETPDGSPNPSKIILLGTWGPPAAANRSQGCSGGGKPSKLDPKIIKKSIPKRSPGAPKRPFNVKMTSMSRHVNVMFTKYQRYVNVNVMSTSCQRHAKAYICLLYTSPSPRDGLLSRMPSSA